MSRDVRRRAGGAAVRWAFRDKTAWWPWFAWHPVLLESGEWAWLERVERRSMPGIRYSYYVHRVLGAYNQQRGIHES